MEAEAPRMVVARRRLGRGGSDRKQRERGAVLIEAALVFPVLLLLILGSFDYGLLFLDASTTSNVTRQGGRVGSAQGNSPLADYNILTAAVSAGSALRAGSLSEIVIFDATCSASGACDVNNDPLSKVPPNCTTASQPGICNYYPAADLTSAVLTPANFGCPPSPAPPTLDSAWCPTTRNVSQANADYIGVYALVNHKWFTGYFGANRLIHDNVVFRLEPVSP